MDFHSETIADIVASLRDGSIYDENGNFDSHEIADRIEAAVRRIRSRCYAAVDSEYDCAHGCEIREAFKGEVNDGV